MKCEKFLQTVERLMKDSGVSWPMVRKAKFEYEKKAMQLKSSTVNNVRATKSASPFTQECIALVLRKLVGNLDWPDDPLVCVRLLSSGEIPKPVDKVNRMVREVHALIDSAQSRTEMVDRVLAYPVADEMRRFWDVVNRTAEEIKIPHFQKDLLQAKMPPGIPTKESDTLLVLAERILDRKVALTKSQQIVWSLAVTAYPPRRSASAPGLKDAARWLAWYWHVAVFEHAEARCKKKRWKSILAEIGSRCPQRVLEVWLLSWLELPLMTQTNNLGPGKIHLFRLGKWFEDQIAL